jgi:hypothetical protein
MQPMRGRGIEQLGRPVAQGIGHGGGKLS